MRMTLLMTAGLERPPGMRYLPIARELVRRGHEVRILALHHDLEQCQRRRFVQEGVEVWYVGQMHARKRGSVPVRHGRWELLRVVIGASWGMFRAILASPADVYHLCKPQPINGLAALAGVMLWQGQRFYVDCDDDEVHSNIFTAAWQRWVFAFWQWLLPRIAAGVTVNTHVQAARLQQQGVNNLVYVSNGVDLAQYQAPAPRMQQGLRAALGLQHQPVMIYAGSLVCKNHPVDLLIAAMPLVVAQIPDVRLLIVGGGEDLPVLQQQTRQAGLDRHIRFVGRQPSASIPLWLSLAQLSIDPVYDDPVGRARSPLKLFESMAMGVPVVTGDVGDRAMLLDDGRAGVLVPAGDAAALARGMLGLLESPERRQQLAQASLARVRAFRWCRVAAQWESVYHRR
ncbi:MAG: glycosyltransferase family 4 protein [Chloroflexaceae bacterium]|nr:glycosyltransferase family 4 protein [Chloroflexaceae bacterium]